MNTPQKHLFPLQLVLVCLLTFTWSCKTQKNITVGKEQASLQTTLLESLNTRSLDTRFSLEVSSTHVNGQLKAVEDSSLMLSIQFMGMEFARMMIAGTDLQIVSRPQKTAFTGSTDIFPSLLPCLQAILMHRIVAPGIRRPTLQDFVVENRGDDGWNLVRRESFCTLTYQIDKDFKLVQTDLEINGAELSAAYSHFEDGFPTVIEVNEPVSGTVLRFVYNRPDTDNRPDIRMEVPSDYRQITLQQMVKSFRF